MSARVPTPYPTHGARTPTSRRLLSAFLVFHLVAMGASLAKKTAAGAAVRTVTAPYERVLGIWQSWGMFGPNPPLGTSWPVVRGTTVDGQEVSLPALVGEKPFDRTDWRYSRIQKVERNMFDAEKGSLRVGYATWLCRSWQGPALAEVRLGKQRHMTQKPGQRTSPAVVKDLALETVPCR